MISSLRARMMLAVGLLAVAAVVAVGLAARQGTRLQFRKFQELEKASTSHQPSPQPDRIAAMLSGRCCTPELLRDAAGLLSPREVLIVVDEKGSVLVKAGEPLSSLSDLRVTLDGEKLSIETQRHEKNGVTAVGLRFRLAGSPLRMADGSAAYLYVLPFPAPESDRPEAVFLGSLDRSLLWVTTLVAALALLVTWTLTRRVVGPIDDLRSAARDLARGNLTRRVETRGSDEIAELARSFNAMASELEQQEILRRNLVHDVVHELRTPLTALRCRIDAVADGLALDPRRAIDGANEEIDHLTRMVDDLHELALAEARELKLTMADVGLAPVVLSAARVAGVEGDPRLRLELDDHLTVRGDAVRLRQVVLNLLSNAVRYTPPEGTIAVRVSRREHEAAVEVHNTGSTLSPEELAHVFDRFYRADPSRQRATGGSGLGLTIVKNLVEAQGGRVWAESVNKGVTFGFALPLSQVPCA